MNEILTLEKKYWKAMGDADIETAVSLTHFPCLVSGPQGTKKISENDYRSMMKSHPMDAFKNIDLQDPQVEFLNDTTAVISYSVEVNGTNMLDVSTWIKENEKWLCAFHAENPKKVA